MAALATPRSERADWGNKACRPAYKRGSPCWLHLKVPLPRRQGNERDEYEVLRAGMRDLERLLRYEKREGIAR
jgi:hypothetical protein